MSVQKITAVLAIIISLASIMISSISMSIAYEEDVRRVRISRKLKKFLRKKKVLRKYKRNTKNNTKHVERGFQKHLYTNIWDAFSWEDTPEGFDFWGGLDDLFEKGDGEKHD